VSRLTRSEAQLLLAAVRVLTHQLERPPTPEQAADLLDMPASSVRLHYAFLADMGAVAMVESAFETHVEVRDHLAVDTLSEEAGPAIADDLEAFGKRKQEESERMANLFASGEHEEKHREKIQQMDEDLEGFRRKKPINPFGED